MVAAVMKACRRDSPFYGAWIPGMGFVMTGFWPMVMINNPPQFLTFMEGSLTGIGMMLIAASILAALTND